MDKKKKVSALQAGQQQLVPPTGRNQGLRQDRGGIDACLSLSTCSSLSTSSLLSVETDELYDIAFSYMEFLLSIQYQQKFNLLLSIAQA